MRDIVFVHGGNHGAWCWQDVIEELEHAGYAGRLVALDVPGCGAKRNQYCTTLSIDAIAIELNAEVRDRSISQALLVGHSMAGIVLPRMIALASDLYAEACFLTAAIPRDGEAIAQLLGAQQRGLDPAVVGYPLPPSVGKAAMFEAMFAPDMTPEQFAMVAANCLLDNWPANVRDEPVSRAGFPGQARVSYIVAERDPILPPAWQGRFAERVGAERLYLLDAPHEPFITLPRELASLLTTIAAT